MDHYDIVWHGVTIWIIMTLCGMALLWIITYDMTLVQSDNMCDGAFIFYIVRDMTLPWVSIYNWRYHLALPCRVIMGDIALPFTMYSVCMAGPNHMCNGGNPRGGGLKVSIF